MICLNKYTLLLYCHLLAWNRLDANPLNLDTNNSSTADLSGLNYAEGGIVKDVSKVTSTSPTTFLTVDKNATVNYAEGGIVKDVSKVTSTSPTTFLTVDKNKTVNSLQDLLENGLPSTGTSKVKPRKEAPPRTIVARKGAPPCLENENTPCTDKISLESSSKSPIALHSEQIESSSEDTSSPLRIDLLNQPSTTAPSLKKPKVTMVLPDSDAFLSKLKNDRNVIIPVAALICTPILVLLALFIYKRVEDTRGNSHYTRMSFLIEDIYND